MGDTANDSETADPAAGEGGGQLSDSPPPTSTRRGALLRLAAWFDSADTATAHSLYTAAFGMSPARHLAISGEESDGTTPVTTSWWRALRAGTDIGQRTAPPGIAGAEDYSGQRTRLLEDSEASAHWRRTAAREIREELGIPTAETGETGLNLSDAAFDVLLELLTAALGSGGHQAATHYAGDLDLDLRLRVDHAPEASVTLRRTSGELRFDRLQLRVSPYSADERGGSSGG